MSLEEHLATGATTIARAWALLRKDGQVLGFTDHDRDLVFEGITFRADAGLSARALEQVTGLAVDNSEAVGALRDAGLTETDIAAGRYDGARIRIWEVNWAAVAQRREIFSGHLGEITREGGAFRAELRGLSEALRQPEGRVYHAACAACLGDAACRFDLDTPGYSVELPLVASSNGQDFTFEPVTEFAQGWFAHGRLIVKTGAAAGLVGLVRLDQISEGARSVSLWDSLRAQTVPGDLIRLEAGCDRQATTCRTKFSNFLNFRGFPHIPGEDWMTAYPKAGQPHSGGSWRS